MWQKDPFKAKWTILAKAYSDIRDAVGKVKAPLNKYLAIACPAIGIISPQSYLAHLNWIVYDKADGGKGLQQYPEPDFAGFTKTIMETNMSELDVVKLCITEGYLPASLKIVGKQLTGPPTCLMASAPTTRPRVAEVEFLEAAARDPQATMASLFGFPVDHPFIQVSAATQPLPTLDLLEMAQGEYSDAAVVEMFNALNAPMDCGYDANEYSQPGYQWTGSMAELYNSENTDATLDFSMYANDVHQYQTFDLSNPADVDPIASTDSTIGNMFLPESMYHFLTADTMLIPLQLSKPLPRTRLDTALRTHFEFTNQVSKVINLVKHCALCLGSKTYCWKSMIVLRNRGVDMRVFVVADYRHEPCYTIR